MITGGLCQTCHRRDATEDGLVNVGRIAAVAIALLAMVIALDEESKVMGLVSYAWAGFGAAFGPTILLSLFCPRMTRQGAMAGILTGGISIVVWKNLEDGVFDLFELLPGFLLSMLAIVAATLLGNRHNSLHSTNRDGSSSSIAGNLSPPSRNKLSQ